MNIGKEKRLIADKMLWGLLLAALFVTGLLLYIVNPYNPDNGLPSSQALALDKSSGLPRYQWVPGKRQSYRFSIVSDIHLQLMKNTDSQQIVQRLEGTLNMRVFDAVGEHITVGFQLSPAVYLVNDQADEKMEQDLSAPFMVEFEQGGRPLAFQFPSTLEPRERKILEEVVRTFQVVLPDVERTTWSVSESHATGTYLANYKTQQDGSLHKQKTLYTQATIPAISGGRDEHPKIQVKKSAMVTWLSPGTAWISKAIIEDRIVITEDSSPFMNAVIKADLQVSSDLMGHDIALFEDGKWDEILLAFSDKSRQLEEEKRTLQVEKTGAGSPEQDLARLIKQLNKGDKVDGAILKGFDQVLGNHPDLAFSLIKRIEQPGIEDNTIATLIHALERAGTPQAQQALTLVMNDQSLREWNQTRAIIALGGVENATDETISTLVDASRNRKSGEVISQASTALFAVGSIGARVRETDPAKAGWIRDVLTETLRSTSNSAGTSTALMAMENMKDPYFAEVIIPYLNHDSHRVRSAAAQALGSTQVKESLGFLAKQLMEENKAPVRSAIVTGMENIGDPSLESLMAVNKMIVVEPNSNTRYTMARYIGDNLDIYPEGVNTIKRLIITDRSKQVRNYAATVLFKMRDI